VGWGGGGETNKQSHCFGHDMEHSSPHQFIPAFSHFIPKFDS
jgi:hypothetical protein